MRTSPVGYESKFADFVKLCRESKDKGISVVIVAHPSVLGDTKEEMIESLYRLSDHGLRLQIANNSPQPAG